MQCTKWKKGSKLEDCTRGLLVHILELKLWHFEKVPICLYREAMQLQCSCVT